MIGGYLCKEEKEQLSRKKKQLCRKPGGSKRLRVLSKLKGNSVQLEDARRRKKMG